MLSLHGYKKTDFPLGMYNICVTPWKFHKGHEQMNDLLTFSFGEFDLPLYIDPRLLGIWPF